MSTGALRPWSLRWPPRWFAPAVAWWSAPVRRRAAPEGLHGLGRHLLADIGIEPGLIASLEAEAHRAELATRWHSGGGW